MHTSSFRFFTARKRTFLIKLVSALGFGGMVGFCILGCDKQAKDTRNATEEVEREWEMTTVYAPPLDLVESNELPNDADSDVLEPSVNAVEPSGAGTREFQISLAYGPPPYEDEIKQPDKPSEEGDDVVVLPTEDESRDIAVKYGAFPPPEREMRTLYGVRMPDNLEN